MPDAVNKASRPVIRRPGERGASIVLLTFLLTFLLIPLIGLGIDGSIVFWVKAKLSAAVDAAALATARNFDTTAGQSYFTANFPTGFLGTSVKVGYPVITLTESPTNVWKGTVQAYIVVPLYFMRILRFQTATLGDTGQATRRDANIMMVLDRSNSMNTGPEPPNNQTACQAMVSAAEQFLTEFVPGHDEVGLITFQTGANLDYSPTTSFDQPSGSNLSETLATLVCAGDTSSAQGLSMAYYGTGSPAAGGIQQMRAARPNALNVILFFTDGEPNGLDATYPIKTLADQSDQRYDPINTSTLVSEPASGCKSTDVLSGIFADGSAETATNNLLLNPTGYTVAVLSDAGVPITSNANPTTISASGCAFPNSNWQYSVYGRLDVAYIPTTDNFGNSTLGSEFGTLDLFPSYPSAQCASAAACPYGGQIRPDMPRTARYVSFNAADSIAHTIRNDMTDNGTLIYTIGLQGNETMAIDQNFMERLANDTRADDYNSAKPTGMFFLATDLSELQDAFLQVASQILHLTQ